MKYVTMLFILASSAARAADGDLLLYDAATQEKFAGCLNCKGDDPTSICNGRGEYGSRLMADSIWNMHGNFGSKYSADSPWNVEGEGLILRDNTGTVYGHFSRNPRILRSQPSISTVRYILKLYENHNDLTIVRDLLCER